MIKAVIMGKHIKPTGKLTYSKLSTENLNSNINTYEAKFPKAKDETEISIIDLFISSVPKNSNVSFNCDRYVQNNEQDLDFTIYSENNTSLLELTELVPNGIGKDGGYSKPAKWNDMNELSDRLIKIIEKKSNKYIGIKHPVDLLIYITDNNANLSLGAENNIKSFLNNNKLIFRKIYFMVPHPIGGIIKELFPNDVKNRIKSGNLGDCIII